MQTVAVSSSRPLTLRVDGRQVSLGPEPVDLPATPETLSLGETRGVTVEKPTKARAKSKTKPKTKPAKTDADAESGTEE